MIGWSTFTLGLTCFMPCIQIHKLKTLIVHNTHFLENMFNIIVEIKLFTKTCLIFLIFTTNRWANNFVSFHINGDNSIKSIIFLV